MQNQNYQKLDRIFSGEINFTFGSSEPGMMPEQTLPEFAIIGKSNVGKSSFINALTNRRSLARVSHTPGRTRQINFFKVQDLFYLVDVPGYGYAKVSKKEQSSWSKLIYSYLATRNMLKHVFLLIDGRRGIKENDKLVLQILHELTLPYSLIYTKCDKISLDSKNLLHKASINYTRYTDPFFTSSVTKEMLHEFKNSFYKMITV